MKKNRLSIILAAIALLTGFGSVAFGQTSPREWGDPHVVASKFGLQTLDFGRTLRLNVLNEVPLNQEGITVQAQAAEQYRVMLIFDLYTGAGDGSVRLGDGSVRFLRRVSQVGTIKAGEGISLDFSEVTGDGSVLVAATALIRKISGNPNQTPSLTTSLEIREGGRSIFSFPGSIKFFNPQPDPPRN